MRHFSISVLKAHGSFEAYSIFFIADLVLVLGWTPTEGEQGQRITVNIDFTRRLDHYVKLRIVVGRRAIATQVRELTDQSNGRWQLEGIVPPFVKQRAVSPTVPIAVQAVNQHDVVLQSVTFGKFTYWESRAFKPFLAHFVR